MSYETLNLARVVAEGFFAVYVKAEQTDTERLAAIASLESILQSVYAQGMGRGQMDFTAKLVKTIGQRASVPAHELMSMASSL